MTQDEIIRMAREAGFVIYDNERRSLEGEAENLKRFAALVAAHAKQEYIDSVYEQHRETMFSNKDLGMLVDAVKAERESCAKVCEESGLCAITKAVGTSFAAAIRARGEK